MKTRLAVVFLAACVLSGCPEKAATSTPALVLRTDQGGEGAVAAAVGSKAALRLTMPPSSDGSQQLFGALLANEPARLTRWHAEPADGVAFEGNSAAFQRPGTWEVWATWTDATGRELTSNRLRFEVR